MRYARDSRQRRHQHPEGHQFPHHPHAPGFEEPGFEGHAGHPEHPGHRGRGGWDGRGRGRGRAGRGDVRAAVLLLLSEEPMHGYQLMQAMADRTNGAWRPSPGAIYPTIAQLEDEGLVTTVAEGGRKLVTLTDAGRATLADNPPVDPFAALVNEPGQKYDLRSGFEEIAIATRLIGKSGSVAQLEAAQQVLADARRSLYLILAEGDRPQPASQPESDA